MKQNILLLEDDSEQRETFQHGLKTRYPGAVISSLATECEFYTALSDMERGQLEPPDIVIADDMVPWETLSRNSTVAPEGVEKGGYSRAGIRCLMRFRERIDIPIPWIMFSILDPETILAEIEDVRYRDKVDVLSKERKLDDLFETIDKFMR